MVVFCLFFEVGVCFDVLLFGFDYCGMVLYWVVICGYGEFCELLFEYGVDLEFCDVKIDKIFVEWVEYLGYYELVE